MLYDLVIPEVLEFKLSCLPCKLTASIECSTAAACIVDAPVTFPAPVNEAEVHTTSPVMPIVLPVANAVAEPAFPEVSAALLGIDPLTSDMFAEPSKLTPPIFLAVAKVVAVVAKPGVILAEPSNAVPPIFLAVANAVAIPAVPEVS